MKNRFVERIKTNQRTLWILLFMVLAGNPAFAQTAGTACADAALLAQWYAWIGAGWGAGIAFGVFAANPIGAGLLATGVITLQVIAMYGGSAGIC